MFLLIMFWKLKFETNMFVFAIRTLQILIETSAIVNWYIFVFFEIVRIWIVKRNIWNFEFEFEIILIFEIDTSYQNVVFQFSIDLTLIYKILLIFANSNVHETTIEFANEFKNIINQKFNEITFISKHNFVEFFIHFRLC